MLYVRDAFCPTSTSTGLDGVQFTHTQISDSNFYFEELCNTITCGKRALKNQAYIFKITNLHICIPSCGYTHTQKPSGTAAAYFREQLPEQDMVMPFQLQLHARHAAWPRPSEKKHLYKCYP